jgi:hypothetical protein
MILPIASEGAREALAFDARVDLLPPIYQILHCGLAEIQGDKGRSPIQVLQCIF